MAGDYPNTIRSHIYFRVLACVGFAKRKYTYNALQNLGILQFWGMGLNKEEGEQSFLDMHTHLLQSTG